MDFLTFEYTPRCDGQEREQDREQDREQGNGAGSREGAGKRQYLYSFFTSKASKLNTNAGAEGAGVMVRRENGANVDKCASVEKRLGALQLEVLSICSIYLLYWYKSTNSDSALAAGQVGAPLSTLARRLGYASR